MGKQTKQKGSHFGGEWTKEKLHIIEEYLKAYSSVLKNQNVKKVYVDGFAGSGKTQLKTERKNELQNSFFSDEDNENKELDGSALISLKYNFDEYYFLELDNQRIKTLKRNIIESYPEKINKVHFVEGDSNNTLINVVSKITKYDRCLMFLDPYALEMNWQTLESISKCGFIDLWYLFPLSIIRLLNKDGHITEQNKKKIDSIIGTDEWYDKIFTISGQVSLFDEPTYNRVSYDELLNFFKDRFKTIFPVVSDDSKVLTNTSKNAPMFLLCFMMTNTSPAAIGAANRIVKGIIKSTEKMNGLN